MKLGVLGCGKMGTALVSGAVAAGVVKASDVLGVGRSEASKTFFAKQTGGRVIDDVAEVVRESEVLLLATKPDDVTQALVDASFKKRSGVLLISVVAGVTLEVLEKQVPAVVRVVRAMPNTPSLIGKGAAGYCLGGRCKDTDKEIVHALFSAVGLAFEVPEKLIDSVAGLSGSGPAYVFTVIEAMADGGVNVGLPRETAVQLAAQTVMGAAEMVLHGSHHTAELRDQVTSPGGTTIAGLAVLEKSAVRSALIEAIAAACGRAEELGKLP